MYVNYGAMGSKLKSQILLDYAFIRERVCTVIMVLLVVN